MRVTHVITRLIVGGAQENTIATVLGLRQIPGLTIHLISGPTRGPEGSLEGELAFDPGLLSIVPELVRPVHPLNDLRALHRLTRLFQQTRPDIVHTHSGKAGILGRWAALRAGVPLILHAIHGPSFGAFQGRTANLLFTLAERRTARVTDHFTVVAEAMRDQYLAAGIGRPEQYTKIFSGFRLEPFLAAGNDPARRAQFGLQPGDFVVGKIARLFELKGHDDLFAAARASSSCWWATAPGARGSRPGPARRGWPGILSSPGWCPRRKFPRWWASWTPWSIFPGGRACPAPCRRPWPPPAPSSPVIATAHAKSAWTARPVSSFPPGI
jgi:hypothetical protein